jgi:site-specific DNA recombinase
LAPHPAAHLAGTYGRLSDLPSMYEQESTRRQDELNMTKADALGVTVPEWARFCDVEKSARKEVYRPQFEAALDALLTQRISTLIVAKLDRLTRRGMGQLGLILDDLEKVGGRIVFVAEGIDSSQPSGRIILAVLSEVARAESDNIGWRVALWHADNRKRGLWKRQRPFGFVVTEDRHLAPHPTEAPIVRRMVDELLRGESLRSVTRRLNDDGIPAPRAIKAEEARAAGRRAKTGRILWHTTTVRGMLLSPILLGFQTYRGEIVRDDDGEPIPVGPGLVTMGEHLRIKAVLERRTTTVRAAQKPGRVGGVTGGGRPTSYLLTGFLRCAECGGPLTGSKNTPPRPATYRCANKIVGRTCAGTAVTVVHVDEAVTSAVLARLAALEPGDPLLDTVLDRWVRQSLPDEAVERTTLTATVEEAEARLADLRDGRYLRHEFDGEDGPAQYERLRTRLTERRDAAHAALSALPPAPTVSVLLDTVLTREAWADATLAQRRDVLSLLLDRVVVVKAPRNGRFFHPERLRFVWAGQITETGPVREEAA